MGGGGLSWSEVAVAETGCLTSKTKRRPIMNDQLSHPGSDLH